MPSTQINTEQITNLISGGNAVTVQTENGNMLLEIQGQLIIPHTKPVDLPEDEEARYSKANDKDIVHFGTLDIEGDKATLYIGKTQRLLGNIKKLSPPLGLLKLDESDSSVKMLDIITHKCIFTTRPLPIM